MCGLPGFSPGEGTFTTACRFPAILNGSLTGNGCFQTLCLHAAREEGACVRTVFSAVAADDRRADGPRLLVGTGGVGGHDLVLLEVSGLPDGAAPAGAAVGLGEVSGLSAEGDAQGRLRGHAAGVHEGEEHAAAAGVVRHAAEGGPGPGDPGQLHHPHRRHHHRRLERTEA